MFKRCFHRTYVYFCVTVIVRFHSCIINDLAGQTMPVQQTPFRCAAIIAPGWSAVLLFCFAYTGIVLFDSASHTWHATLAYLNCVSIKVSYSGSILSKASVYSNLSKKCNLCLTEKLMIISANKSTLLNRHSELISKSGQQNCGRGYISYTKCAPDTHVCTKLA